jgi:hypothetical protein
MLITMEQKLVYRHRYLLPKMHNSPYFYAVVLQDLTTQVDSALF